MTLLMDMANLYNDAGLSMVTLHPFNKETNGCGCGYPDCEVAGKHPVMTNWQNMMGQAGPFKTIKSYVEYGIDIDGFGWLLGDEHLVVDIDPKNGGNASYDKLVALVPELDECNVVIKTGGGGRHLYYKKPADLKVVGTHRDYPGIDFKQRGGFVVAAGSLHKSGERYDVGGGYSTDLNEMDDAPTALLEIIHKDMTQRFEGGEFDGDLADVVMAIPNNDVDYDTWCSVGMAIHDTDAGAFDLWDLWSQRSGKYSPEKMAVKWHSFGKNPSRVTIGTLIMMAEENGYKRPARGGCEVIIPEGHKPETKRISVEGIDLLNPPGLVGDIAKLINDTALYSRAVISVGAAFFAVSSAMGRMYVGPTGGKLNLYMLCIAASGSGKSHPYNIIKKLMINAGSGRMLSQEMASGQDMYRNVLDNQAMAYTMDEAHKKFTPMMSDRAPSYLQEIEAAMLTLYSESNLMPRDIDTSKFLESIDKALNRLDKECEDATQSEEVFINAKRERLMRKRSYVEKGLDNPFANIYATSTPIKLDSIISEDNIGSGLIGRFLLFREWDDAPMATTYGIQEDAFSLSIPDNLQERFNRVIQKGMANDVTFTWRDDFSREFFGTPIKIATTKECRDLSRDTAIWFDKCKREAKPEIAPLWARAQEQTIKLASVLAVETLSISEGMFRWAFARVCEDIKCKILLCMAATGDTKGADDIDRGRALASRITTLCKSPGGLPQSKLFERLKKKYAQPDIDSMLEKLIADNRIEREELRGGAFKYKTLKDIVD